MSDYTTIAAELDRIGLEFARTRGKEELIEQYRELIDAYPGFANNMQMETQIALIYEWDLSESGQPPNPEAAFSTLTDVINTYDPGHPYMKRVRQLAANRAMTVDPKIAKDMYTGLLEDYPEDDILAVESLFSLGQMAEKQGDVAEATRMYEQAMGYTPGGEVTSDTASEEVLAYQTNAAAALIGSVLRQYDNPEERLRAMDEFLKEHAGFAEMFGDLTQRMRETIEVQVLNQAKAASGVDVQTASASNVIGTRNPAKGASRGARESKAGSASDATDAESRRMAAAAGDPAWGPSGDGGSASNGGAIASRVAAAAQVIASSSVARLLVPAILALGVLGVVVFVRRRLS
jgi:hypothetical protein